MEAAIAKVKDSKSMAMKALVAVCIMQIAFPGIGWNAISLYSAPVVEEWGIIRASFMLSITIVALCNTFLSMFLYGPLYQKLGMRKLIIGGGVLCCVGYAVFGMSQNMAMFYIGAILFGIGCALVNTKAGYMVCEKWFKRNAATYMGITQTCNTITGVVATTIVSFIMLASGWRSSLFILAGVFLIGMIVALILYKGDPEDLGVEPYDPGESTEKTDVQVAGNSEEGNWQGLSYRDTLKTAQYWVVVIAFFFVGIVAYSLLANLALLFSDFGFETLSGTALSVCMLGAGIITIPLGRIMDLKGTASAMAICFTAIVIASLIMLFGNINIVVAYVIALLIGIGYAMCNVAPGSIARETFGSRDYAKKMGVIYAIMCAGIAVGPTFMSLFYDLGGGSYNTYFIISSIVAVILAVGMFPLSRPKKAK